ncbi:MAG: integrase, partial [Gemmatimonadetes bacterium]|nr:integrase [Gemmatimonadota bacterium]
SHIENYVDTILDRASASHAATIYRRLQQCFRWLTDEDEIGDNPMRRMSPPQVPEQPIPVVAEDDLRALLHACEGRTFEA